MPLFGCGGPLHWTGITFPAEADPTSCAREAVARLAGAVHESAMRSIPIVALVLVRAVPSFFATLVRGRPLRIVLDQRAARVGS